MRVQTIHLQENAEPTTKPPEYKWEMNWVNILALLIMHVTGIYGIYLSIVSAQWKTVFWGFTLVTLGLIGMTAGTHRLWCHRTYTAKLPLQILLCIFQTLCLQHHIYDWVQHHRVHHKYVDTDADPYNAKRGFFFSHMGWLCIKRTPEAIAKYESINLSDIYSDKLVMFQRKYYFVLLAPLVGVLLPSLVPWYFWGESFITSICATAMLRQTLCTHSTASINSFAHMFGNRPYDKGICPTENLGVSVFTLGEGWHNFHHTFPMDYKAGEFGKYSTNIATAFIDFMAAVGWAYDLKTVSEEMIVKRARRTGDGTMMRNGRKLES